jgi:hypothetical protein
MLLVNKLAVAQPANVNPPRHKAVASQKSVPTLYVCSHTDDYLPFVLFIQETSSCECFQCKLRLWCNQQRRIK